LIRTLRQAAGWVDEVGLALVFPKADVVLPSLWEQVNGSPARDWAVRDPEGGFVRWTEEMGFLWSAKDALPAEGLVCVGRHLARSVSCIAPRLLPTLVAASGMPDDGDPVAEAIGTHGPLTGPQLRRTTGLAKKDVDRSLNALHRGLVVTSAHLVEGEAAWGSLAHDLLARKWALPKRLPDREQSRLDLVALVLEQAGELTAADLSAVFGWRRKESAALLEQVGEGRDEDGFRIWTRR
jgi:Winged helix DNA-binding domain